MGWYVARRQKERKGEGFQGKAGYERLVPFRSRPPFRTGFSPGQRWGPKNDDELSPFLFAFEGRSSAYRTVPVKGVVVVM